MLHGTPEYLTVFMGGYSTVFDTALGADHQAALSIHDHADFWSENAASLSNPVHASDLKGLLLLTMHTI